MCGDLGISYMWEAGGACQHFLTFCNHIIGRDVGCLDVIKNRQEDDSCYDSTFCSVQ